MATSAATQLGLEIQLFQVALRIVLSLVSNDPTGLNRKVLRELGLHRALVHKLVEEFTFCSEDGARCLFRESKTVVAVWGHLVGAPPDVEVMGAAVALCLLLQGGDSLWSEFWNEFRNENWNEIPFFF